MQLLKITSVPLEYEIHTEAARLEMKQAQNPSHVMTKNPSGWTMHARNIQVRMDTTELRASLNMHNSMDFARYYGSQGRQAAYQAVGEAVQFGNQMQQIQDGVSIGQIIRQRLLQQPETYTTFLPSAGTDISWQPAQLDKQYNPGSLEFDWQIMQNQMNFIPGKFQFEITQYPDVRVEYLGKPAYVPPSASPDYVEPA